MKYLLILILLLTFILLLSYIKFNIQFIYKTDEVKFEMSISLFKIFNFKIKPFSDKKRKINKKSGFNQFYLNKDFLNYILDKIILKQLTWKTKIGFNDAFLTAIVYGSIWSIKSVLISFILTNKEIEYLDFDVEAIFNKEELNVLFNCIIRIRMVYIIIIWIKILRMRKGGGKNVRTSNRRAYAYNNE
ncbi:DUF2953 family protein [Keratinibaculum paraultunense]|uniref:DUF2953 family protein n=1 Tax=Keratinibaculum paraultunense TaxID=1278232 RepID=A0A4R3L081_9FIRM|nr:DUF2953 domain-containing protein [Keratinibaculum paraultunense]QQY80639.1 DUF2953 domain-containing protein [Keratinibaculum paraultunense]TCS91372.1 DUF2953 family protein [Keratinibaculum paraultunense]